MAEGTKERILETALELFAQNGYLGTSMNDIAARLGITKAALYKHYAGKQEILKRIVERMDQMDKERAEAYEMPICTRPPKRSAPTAGRSSTIGQESRFPRTSAKC